MKDVTNQVWAYLHDELSPDERARFEQESAGNTSMRETLEECRTMHRELELLADQHLEEQLVAEWESEHPEFDKPRKQSRNRTIRFMLPLAAAAALILIIALPRQEGPIHWQRTICGATPQLRGQTGAKPRYTQEELKQLGRNLQHIIDTRIKELPEQPAPWKLKIQLQELANGYLAVEITGHPLDHPKQVRIWDETYRGLDNIKTNAPEFGKRIVDELAERTEP